MRDRMAGPENGLFFPIRPNKMLWRMKGGDKPDVSPLFSVENGRCIRIPLPGLSNTQRFIDATITITAQRRFTDNDCTHCIFCLLMAGSRHPNAGRAQSAPSAPETGFQCTDTRMTYLHTRLNDFTNDDETDDCTHRMRDRALPSGGRGATPRRISESAPFGPETGSQRIGARRTRLLTCFHIQLAALTLTDATDKICGLKPLSTTYTVVNAEGRLVL